MCSHSTAPLADTAHGNTVGVFKDKHIILDAPIRIAGSRVRERARPCDPLDS